MTEIKTSQAWGSFVTGTQQLCPMAVSVHHEQYPLPVVIVHGLTEAEVHAAAALLAKSREEHEEDSPNPFQEFSNYD